MLYCYLYFNIYIYYTYVLLSFLISGHHRHNSYKNNCVYAFYRAVIHFYAHFIFGITVDSGNTTDHQRQHTENKHFQRVKSAV